MGDKPIGTLLRELRIKAGLSQRKLGLLSGVERGYINQLEAGKTVSMTLVTLTKLAKGLGMPPSVFLDLATTDDAEIKAFLVNEFPQLDAEGKDWIKRSISMVRERQREKYNAEEK